MSNYKIDSIIGNGGRCTGYKLIDTRYDYVVYTCADIGYIEQVKEDYERMDYQPLKNNGY